MRRTAIALIVLFLMIASWGYGAVMVRYDLFPLGLLRSAWRHVAKSPTPSVWYDVWRERFEQMPITADNVMLGDSLTAQIDWHEFFPTASLANRGIAGDTIKLMLNRLDPILEASPKKVFVMAGINDITGGADGDQIAMNYRMLVERLSKGNISVVVQSTLLTDRPELNFKVANLNRRLVRLCDELACKFIDLNSRMAPNGKLINSIDGVHLLLSGYITWRDLIAAEIVRKPDRAF